jgi:ADP-heptose:LPS heptosyltransferase
MEDIDIQRVLIFLLGSLGDTLVALPSLHLIARRFPSAQRRVLTDRGSHPKAASMDSLLGHTGLVHDYFWFPPPPNQASRLRQMISVAKDIRAWKPDALIYLHEQRGQTIAVRDAILFRMLGIRRLIGIPLTADLQRNRFRQQSGRFEHRSEYLERTLAPLGDPRLTERSSWDLAFTPAERARARAEIEPLRACPGILAMSIGTKVDVNDWGDENWRGLLVALRNDFPDFGLVALGAPVEAERSSGLLAYWRGPVVNLCGKLTVRESGALMERVQLFIGHDSGPMHLAAAVGTPSAAIFSARHLPGLWFPYGDMHKVFYNKTDCAGCRLNVCVDFNKKCIAGISVGEVSAAVVSMLSSPLGKALNRSAHG